MIFGWLWGRMVSCAPIGNRRNGGLTTRLRVYNLPHRCKLTHHRRPESMMGLPIPFEAALQNYSRPVASKIEARAQVDAEPRPQFPVASDKQLMHLRLSARRDVDALDFSVVFERWRKGFALPSHQQSGLEVPPAPGAWTVHRTFENGIENNLPSRELTVQDRTQLHPARILFVPRLLK